MAKTFLISIDLSKNELLNARIQNLASAPSSPVEGQVYYDTTLHQFGCYQNSTWTYLAATVTNGVTKAANAGATNVLQVSGGTDKTIADYAPGGAGLVKVASTGVPSLATPGTDYVTGSSSNALTNKTFDANGTGNSISNIEVADFAANVVDTDSTFAANSDSRIPTQKAVNSAIAAISQGLRWKAPVRVATVSAGTLASSFANGSAVDGVTLATGDRILIKNQSSGSENGIYVVAASGAPARDTDADTAAKLKGMVVDVLEGTANADTAWVLTNDSITLGSTALTYVDYVKANVPTATTSTQGKVYLASQAEAEAKSDTSKAVVPAGLANFPIKKTATIGDGSTTAIAVSDNLGTIDKIAIVRDASTNVEVECDKTYATNTTTFTFAVAPASNAYKVVIIG